MVKGCERETVLGVSGSRPHNADVRRRPGRIVEKRGQPHAHLTPHHERSAATRSAFLKQRPERRTLLLATEPRHHGTDYGLIANSPQEPAGTLLRILTTSTIRGHRVSSPAATNMRARGAATRRAFALLLLALSENKTFGTGPNGEQPTPRIDFGLSPHERRQVRAMHATAAIVLHYGGNDWSRAQIAGL